MFAGFFGVIVPDFGGDGGAGWFERAGEEDEEPPKRDITNAPTRMTAPIPPYSSQLLPVSFSFGAETDDAGGVVGEGVEEKGFKGKHNS